MLLGSLLEVITESAKGDVEDKLHIISNKYQKLYEKQLKHFALTFNNGAVPIAFESGIGYVDDTGKGRDFDDEWLYVHKNELSGKAKFCVVITFNRNKFVQMYKADPKRAMSEADKAISNAYRQAMSIVKRDMR